MIQKKIKKIQAIISVTARQSIDSLVGILPQKNKPLLLNHTNAPYAVIHVVFWFFRFTACKETQSKSQDKGTDE